MGFRGTLIRLLAEGLGAGLFIERCRGPSCSPRVYFWVMV